MVAAVAVAVAEAVAAAAVASAVAAAAAAFLRNHRKQERHCASNLCNDHAHHIRNVQRCSFPLLLVRHLSQMPRQLVM